MMKKLFLMLVVVSGMSLTANAQWGWYYPSCPSTPDWMNPASSYWQNHYKNYMNQFPKVNYQSAPQYNYSYDVQPVYNNTEMYSNSNNDNNNDVSNSSSRSPKTCGLCGGKGTIAKSGTTFGLSDKKWCSECGKEVSVGHYHENCPSCNGAGRW